jgi:DNA-binding beta-propeller fold protein YncE
MSRPYGLFRAGFPYVKTLGMRRVTNQSMDVAIGKDGTMYVLGRAGTVSRLTWEDEDLGNVSGGGKGDGKFVWPVAMVIDSDEHLWITDESLNRITVLDTEGEFVRKWGESGDEDGQLDGPSGIAFDSDENVYIADTRNHRIQKFTNDGEFQLKWGSLGDGEGELNMPWGITVDELGDVYVADWRNDRIQKFSAEGEFISTLGKSGSGKGQFNRPAGVEVDSDGDIYVADTGNNRVQQFSAEGRYVEQFIGDATTSVLSRRYLMSNATTLRLREMTDLEPAKRLRSPRSARFDDQGRMYIPDFGSFRVQIYQKDVIPLAVGEIEAPLRAPTLFTA